MWHLTDQAMYRGPWEDELIFETMRTKDHNKEGSEGKRPDGPFFILELDEGKWKSP